MNRSENHGHNPLVNYELTGTVRWLDVELERIVLGVEAVGGHAGPFLGRDVSVDLEAARVQGCHLDELLPGTSATVHLRLPRDLRGRAPDLLPALRVTAIETAED